MELQDRIFLATMATLFLAVLWIERRKHPGTTKHVMPPPGGTHLLSRMNVPVTRQGDEEMRDAADAMGWPDNAEGS